MTTIRFRPTTLMRCIVPFLASACMAGPLVLEGEGVGQPPDEGTDAQEVLMARRAAEVLALRDLARQLHGSVVSDDGKSEWISGLVKGHKFLEPTVAADGSVRIVAQITLDQVGLNYQQLWQRAQAAEARTRELKAEVAELELELAAGDAENEALKRDFTRFQQQVTAQMQAAALQTVALQARIAQLEAQVRQLQQP